MIDDFLAAGFVRVLLTVLPLPVRAGEDVPLFLGVVPVPFDAVAMIFLLPYDETPYSIPKKKTGRKYCPSSFGFMFPPEGEGELRFLVLFLLLAAFCSFRDLLHDNDREEKERED